MANTNFIIKRSNGTTWDELYPKSISDNIFVDSAYSIATTKAGIVSGDSVSVALSKIEKYLQSMEDTGNKNIANGYAGLDSTGKLLESVIPSLSLMDVFEANSQANMLLLSNARKGDICIRTDINKTFILAVDGYGTLANWKELKTPTDTVLSVNSKTGAVTLVASDVGAESAFSKNSAFNKNFETSTSNIKMNGTVAVGTSSNIARADHVHPVDTSRVPTSRKVNNKALSSDITLSASDIGVPQITYGSVAPTSPAVGDLWLNA